MSKTSIRGLPKDERDRIRREQIVEAAARCVMAHGFHKSSLGLMAAEAAMSVGQIYRYFRSKHEIIEAVVLSRTESHLVWIASTGGSRDLAGAVAAMLADTSEERLRDRVLLLEIHAEAARNPAVAAILREADERLHALAEATMRADYPGLGGEEAAVVAEYMATFTEGRLLRQDKTSPDMVEKLMALHGRVVALLCGEQKPE